MIKNLYLLRHARSSEKASGQQDIERTLNSTGLQNATRMGINFTQKNYQFDIILCSPAIRALATASLIAEQIKYDTGRIHQNDEIYEASIRTLLRVVNQLKEEWNSVLIVGHNPSVTYLSEYLTKAEIGDMTTCGVTHIQFENLKWEEVSEATGNLVSYEHPDQLNF
ncbi:SixA phosphatase family protein [Fulvivirga lutimaris]|uniref:SixA phosphatase family protein n=1 Tax=Fulvivirga lutimaris TaxID=1819566 RepID=UPI0012BBF0FB|nr:histidine phosphatase family protein [Fulvivirga lutimaris]MTI40684.1 histidine phosphatase family protein [Fulvivirga lutimaris]